MNKTACLLIVTGALALSGCGGKLYRDQYGYAENNRHYQEDAASCKDESYKQYPPRQYDNVVSTVMTGLSQIAGVSAPQQDDEYAKARESAFDACIRRKGWYYADK